MLISAHLVIIHSREWCATHISVQGNPFTKQLVYIQVQRSSKGGPVKLGHSSCVSPSAEREKIYSHAGSIVQYCIWKCFTTKQVTSHFLRLTCVDLCISVYSSMDMHCHWRWARQNLEMGMRSLFSQQI